MNEDIRHLQEYARSGSQAAFTAIVERNLPLVYGAALRRVGGDTHRAEDVCQLVFTALARDAARLTRHPNLTGWLFTTTRFIATKTLRTEWRRGVREEKAAMEAALMTDSSPQQAADVLTAVVDDLVAELRDVDREVVLLRFHRRLRLADVAAQLGSTENAVQKRLARALDELKSRLSRRGITSTSAALALTLEGQAIVSVPSGVAATAVAAALTGGGAVASGAGAAILGMKFKLAMAAVVVATAGVWELKWFEGQRLRAQVAEQDVAYRRQSARLEQELRSLQNRERAAKAAIAELSSATSGRQQGDRSWVLTDERERMEAAMTHAGELAREGNQQGALEEYLRFYTSTTDPISMQTVLMMIARFGDTFPPAITALRDLRDVKMQELKATTAPAKVKNLVRELSLLNRGLHDVAAAVELFDYLPATDSGSGGRGTVAALDWELLLEARRYDAIVENRPFGQMLADLDAAVRNKASDWAVRAGLGYIEALTAGGRNSEAQTLARRLATIDGSEKVREAIRRRIERARQPQQK